jgi:hypothetical protein
MVRRAGDVTGMFQGIPNRHHVVNLSIFLVKIP